MELLLSQLLLEQICVHQHSDTAPLLALICVLISVGKKIIRRVDKKLRKKNKDGDLMNYHGFLELLDAARNRCENRTAF